MEENQNARFSDFIDLPPVWLAGCILVAWGLAQAAPLITFTSAVWQVVGWGLIAAGLLLAVWAMVAFRRFKTSVIPRQTPSALIDEAPYSFSRNPIYLADLIILAGCVALFGAVSAVVTLQLFWAAMQHRFILPEEEVMRQTFGARYDDYCQGVRRWV